MESAVEELVVRLVRENSGWGYDRTPGLTLADLAAQALTDAVDRLEKKKGAPFPPRKADLKGGRPMK